VGTTKLSEILKEVETQVKNKHYDQLHPLTEKLMKESKLIWEDLEQL
jgi:tRNA A37 threonylcarbamoyladenosine modification protein TsaB